MTFLAVEFLFLILTHAKMLTNFRRYFLKGSFGKSLTVCERNWQPVARFKLVSW